MDKQTDLISRLQEEADWCRNDGADDIASMLDEAVQVIRDRDVLRTNTQNLAMMLRKCAHRLKCNGHEDLSADVVGLLRRYGLIGTPLRGTETEHG